MFSYRPTVSLNFGDFRRASWGFWASEHRAVGHACYPLIGTRSGQMLIGVWPGHEGELQMLAGRDLRPNDLSRLHSEGPVHTFEVSPSSVSLPRTPEAALETLLRLRSM